MFSDYFRSTIDLESGDKVKFMPFIGVARSLLEYRQFSVFAIYPTPVLHIE